MASFRSTKQAMGWLSSFRQGPTQAKPSFEPPPDTPLGNEGDDIELLGVLGRVCARTGCDVERVYDWATTSDGALPVNGTLGATLHFLRVELEAAGLVQKRVTPVICEVHWWQCRDTGRWYRSTRAK